MAGTQTEVRNAITVRGSAEIVAEFIDYGINSILYQRGIYPPESFTRAQKYGLTLLVSTDEKIKGFINVVLGQIKEWLEAGKVQKIVMVIASVQKGEPLERWEFGIQYDDTKAQNDPKYKLTGEKTSKKDLQQIQKEIRDVIRQITASVTFLPLLDTLCSFDLQVYGDKSVEMPENWDETQPVMLTNAQEVQLKSFSTDLHTVQSFVSYKLPD
ncbi:unnamed protein product [Darwinula stevensoni]|uniref:Mitotic spindle assembly checkpoint protein MAD2A n=1 Tax=Darwinula stevensoni TaxID=69355 RepID=A0A7R8XFW3_9CRUS|nr:unnamed protein product [Darwinula stevensoni]CAG0891103.1 unnamed protein product [Darwinula stevensoni]